MPPPVLTSCLPNVPHGNQVSVVGAGHRTYSEFTVLHGFTYIRVCTVALPFCNSDFENWSCSASSPVLDIILSDHYIFQGFFPTNLVGVE